MKRERLLGIFFAIALLGGGCGGATVEQQEAMQRCYEKCKLEVMTCLETNSCTAMDGQTIPCEQECAETEASCAEACQQVD